MKAMHNWLAVHLPPSRIVLAATASAIDVVLLRPPASVETIADPYCRVVSAFDAIRRAPREVLDRINGSDVLEDRELDAAARWILRRPLPERTNARRRVLAHLDPHPALEETERRLARLLEAQYDTEQPAELIARYDTPESLVILRDPPASAGQQILEALRNATAQAAVVPRQSDMTDYASVLPHVTRVGNRALRTSFPMPTP